MLYGQIAQDCNICYFPTHMLVNGEREGGREEGGREGVVGGGREGVRGKVGGGREGGRDGGWEGGGREQPVLMTHLPAPPLPPQVKVMELSDALESAGSYTKTEIAERLQKYRDRLMQVRRRTTASILFRSCHMTRALTSDLVQESVEPSRSPTDQQRSLRRSRSPSPAALGNVLSCDVSCD